MEVVVSPEVEVYEVELVKNNVGLGITIAGYISDKPNGTLLPFTVASVIIVIIMTSHRHHHHHQYYHQMIVICSALII